MELEILQQIFSDVLHVDTREVVPEATIISDLGADSLDLFQVVTALEEKFDIDITSDDLRNVVTIEDAIGLIRRKINK